jgi:hypothetical protein
LLIVVKKVRWYLDATHTGTGLKYVADVVPSFAFLGCISALLRYVTFPLTVGAVLIGLMLAVR